MAKQKNAEPVKVKTELDTYIEQLEESLRAASTLYTVINYQLKTARALKEHLEPEVVGA